MLPGFLPYRNGQSPSINWKGLLCMNWRRDQCSFCAVLTDGLEMHRRKASESDTEQRVGLDSAAGRRTRPREASGPHVLKHLADLRVGCGVSGHCSMGVAQSCKESVETADEWCIRKCTCRGRSSGREWAACCASVDRRCLRRQNRPASLRSSERVEVITTVDTSGPPTWRAAMASNPIRSPMMNRPGARPFLAAMHSSCHSRQGALSWMGYRSLQANSMLLSK